MEISNKWIVVEMEGVVREFSVFLLALELSSIFIKSLDSEIENVLLTFGEKKCSWERLLVWQKVESE